ncbi:DUF6155 family protein [Endozoicomonas sp. YOMI1]|uniref:DUF6155 family protein n=1 Tax=Endozoicomonas sp. YOMI1 TaxID=2828739 RepID=UPI0021495C8E|nr:DUF6155 family protein [Endozoicomonas sp. YOMI1]
MAKKATLTDLKKHLRKMTQNELVDEIANLYKKLSNVKEYYQSSLFDDDSTVLSKYKKVVEQEFIATGRSFAPKMRLSVARKAISDYKKVSISNEGIADIMLTYVEAGIDCTNEFGDIDEGFYSSMEGMYEDALDYMDKEGLINKFKDRLWDAVENTSGIGWCFHDTLSDLYDTYVGDGEEAEQ